MLNKYLILALLVCVVAAFSGYKGYQFGKDKINALWLLKQAEENANAAKRINELQNEARAKESLSSVNINAIANRLNEVQNALREKDNIIDDLRTGNIRLQERIAMHTDGSAAAKTGAGAAPDNAGAGCELSAETSGFLYGEASRADAIVYQLKACQEVLIDDRRGD